MRASVESVGEGGEDDDDDDEENRFAKQSKPTKAE